MPSFMLVHGMLGERWPSRLVATAAENRLTPFAAARVERPRP